MFVLVSEHDVDVTSWRARVVGTWDVVHVYKAGRTRVRRRSVWHIISPIYPFNRFNRRGSIPFLVKPVFDDLLPVFIGIQLIKLLLKLLRQMPARQRAFPVLWFICDVRRRHAEVIPRVRLLREFVAGEHGRPVEVEGPEQRLALGLDLQAHGAAGGDDERLVHQLRAHGRVQRAQEELQQAGAPRLHQGQEVFDARLSLDLALLACKERGEMVD